MPPVCTRVEQAIVPRMKNINRFMSVSICLLWPVGRAVAGAAQCSPADARAVTTSSAASLPARLVLVTER